MDIQEIQHQLNFNHQAFLNFITSLTPEEFVMSNNQKWTAGQQLEHIYKSVKPVNTAMALPKAAIKMNFGEINRSVMTYSSLVEEYTSRLAKGTVAVDQFMPDEVSLAQKEDLLKRVSDEVNKLVSKLADFSAQELDSLVLPHPLLGKLTLREMMYFTIYHVIHHLKMIKKNLDQTLYDIPNS